MVFEDIFKENEPVEKEIRTGGLNEAEAVEYRALDRLSRLVGEQLLFTELAYHKERIRLRLLQLQYQSKQEGILKNRKALIEGGKQLCQTK